MQKSIPRTSPKIEHDPQVCGIHENSDCADCRAANSAWLVHELKRSTPEAKAARRLAKAARRLAKIIRRHPDVLRSALLDVLGGSLGTITGTLVRRLLTADKNGSAK
jgi:hypothetical protein